MKKSLLIVGALVLVFLLSAFTLPYFFKDQIKGIVDNAVAESLEAEISYHEFSLSLFKRFPNLSLSVESLSISGQNQFKGDTLVAVDLLTISVNPISALFSDKLEVKSLEFKRPRIQILVDKNGSANYNITKEDQTAGEEETQNYQLSIDQWIIEQGTVAYLDQQSEIDLRMDGIDHRGSGNFTLDQFDLTTSSELNIRDLSYQGISYLSNKEVSGEMVMEINLPDSRYTFKQNEFLINQLAVGLDGWVSLPEDSDDIEVDISLNTDKNEFKDLLSLVPGMYGEDFENIEADGLITIDGYLKGTYGTDIIPSFQVALKVENGRFHYPELPSEVQNINLDLLLANSDGDINTTLLDISTLHLDFGDSPLDGSIRVDGFSKSEIDADLSTQIDLATLTSIVPISGMELRGNYELNLTASGVYDSAAQTFPLVDAHMSLENGYIKSQEFPESIERINLNTTVVNQTGSLPDTKIEISEFDFLMDGEPFSGHLTLVNPHDFSWELDVKGGVDLEKVDKILDLEGIDLQGKITGQLDSKGTVSSLEEERYAEIPTSGDLLVEQFIYNSQDLSHPFQISTGKAVFNPEQIVLSDVYAETGSSDLTINGELTNYLNYLFQDLPVKGSLDIDSRQLDLNQWMEDSDTPQDSVSLSVLEIPTNVDFTVRAKAATVLYDNMTLKNARGQVNIRNGLAELHNLSFNALGGGFLISGVYNPTNPKDPQFNMDVEMQQVGFKEAFHTFNTVKMFAPIAELLQGNFSSNFELNGALTADMTPNLSTLSATGLVNILAANLSASDTKLINGLNQITQFNSTPTEFKINDVVIAVQIKDGQMQVAPFTTYFGDYKTIVSGSSGIDGTMNFGLNMEVPAGIVGTSVNQAISKLTGNNQPADDKLNLNINLAGSYQEPSFSLGDLQAANTTTGMAKSAVDQKSSELKDSANQLVDQESKRLTETAKQQLDSLITGNVEDSTSGKIVKDAAEDLLDKDKVKDVFNLFRKEKKSKQDSTDTKK